MTDCSQTDIKTDQGNSSQPESGENNPNNIESRDNKAVSGSNQSADNKSDAEHTSKSDTVSKQTAQIKAEISRDCFELILCDSCDKATDIIANSDYHAFFIKDDKVGECLDNFNTATAEVRKEDHFKDSLNSQLRNSIGLYPPLAKRLRNKKDGTKVLFTDKRKVPVNTFIYARKLICDICKCLKIPEHDGKLIQVAGEIYNLAKLQHPGHSQTRFRDMVSINTRFLKLLNDHSELVEISRLIYCPPNVHKGKEPSLQIIGASVIGITDLLIETINLNRPLTGEGLLVLSQALRNLTPRLFLKEVVESLISILENQLMPSSGPDYKRVVIYSDRPAGLFAVEKQLKSRSFQVIISDSLEYFVNVFRQQHPGIIILWLYFSSGEIVKVLQFLLNNKININAVPTFLIVKGNVVRHLSSIIEMDSIDILDLESSLDVLLFKIGKVREKLEEPSRLNSQGTNGKSGSTGNLKDMNLIDLLQAMGPSKRTARIKINSEESPSDPLIFYLSQGNIIYAQLGSLLGEMAIFRALTWENGTWTIEQVSDNDLPEPNNDRPNEFILMEGCRLLDEKSS